jgi:hypothetical protein
MTSQLKIEANRRNAKRSTGPKSAPGRQRASRNARRHGLNVPIWADQLLSEQAHALAEKLAAESKRSDFAGIPGRVAEAQIDLIRIRGVKDELLKILAATLCGGPSVEPALREAGPSPSSAGALLAMLKRLDRYERRTLSRRKTAIRDLQMN